MPRISWFLMIFGGFTLVVLLLRPPHTPCDTQKNLFIEKYKNLLSSSLGQKKKSPSLEPMTLFYNQCRVSNTIGGCVEFFRALNQITKDIQKNDSACVKKFLSDSKLYRALQRYTTMVIVAAWRGNQNEISPWGDMDWADLYLYCRLKDILIESKGQQNWEKFKKSTLKLIGELHSQQQLRPQKKIQNPSLYKKTLFYVSCKRVKDSL